MRTKLCRLKGNPRNRDNGKSQPFPRLTQDPFTDNEKDIMTSYFTKTYLSLEDNGRAI